MFDVPHLIPPSLRLFMKDYGKSTKRGLANRELMLSKNVIKMCVFLKQNVLT